ncbi:uncharacterized protein I303_101584 [Kwoniella dejecticola CBS 10117]|uniref:BRCT domain-containing protein n=1 Tax=Kwoniella dejecticola CBS 10117 TaxID=1296121 RepID=A0A1A6ADD4_9TREE|nr:uncharacterized protein I303_02283 [Kwoniella dejecticola CBS 10117]OBR88064.1 hypothetical protein I303_02283 [Kwoniella dejecticola CBS 10117]
MPPQPEVQSQEFTQQPSIDILPVPPIPFEPPLSAVEEEEDSLEILNSDFELNHTPLGTTDGSSLEETGDSGLKWTQTQLNQNARLQVEPNGVREIPQVEEESNIQHMSARVISPPPVVHPKETREAEKRSDESEDGVITSPDVPGSLIQPRKATHASSPKSSALPAPSSPLTEQDELANGSSRQLGVEGGLEETEVDIPHIQTPEQSQPPSTPPVRPLTSTAPTTSSKNGEPGKRLQGVTSYSPSRFTNGLKPDSLKAKSATTSPSKIFASKKAFLNKKRKEPSPDIEESMFGREPHQPKCSDPLDNLRRLQSERLDETKTMGQRPENKKTKTASKEHDHLEDILERRLTENSHSYGEEGTEGVNERRDKTEEQKDEPEDEQEGVNWDKSLPVTSLLSSDDIRQSRTPSPSSAEAHANPSSSPNQVRPHDSPQAIHLNENSRFHRFANSGSTSSQRADQYSGDLFSDMGEEVPDLPESQHTVLFPATQVVPRLPSSTPAADPASGKARSSIALEATQPDDTQIDDLDTPGKGAAASVHTNPSSSPPPPLLSRADSNLSTHSKVSVPSHRQLTRRSRTQDHSSEALPADDGRAPGVVAAPNDEHTARNLSRAPSNLSATSRISVPSHRQLTRRSRGEPDLSPNGEIPRTSVLNNVTAKNPAVILKPNRSEAIIPAAELSPFKRTSPHRVSSEPPMLQETLKNSIESGSSLLNERKSAEQNQHTHITGSTDSLLRFTSPRVPSSPYKRSASSSSPSLQARDHPALPTSLDAMETTQPDVAASIKSDHAELSLQIALPPRISPKRYNGHKKRKRILSSPAPGSESAAESSSTAPDDELDHTFRPPKSTKRPKKETSTTARMTKPANSRKSANPLLLPSKRKPKPIIRSSSPSNPPSDSQSSSSAPEDLEDNTYQPSLFPRPPHLLLEKHRKRVSTSSTSTARKLSTKKGNQSKPNARVARLSPSVSISNVSEPVLPTPETFAVLAAFFHRYYPGEAVWTGKAYNVSFYDGEQKKNVKAESMRQLVLKKGDSLEGVESRLPAKFEVARDWDGHADGVKCITEKGESLGRVSLKDFGISNKVIHSTFQDRLFEDPHSSNAVARRQSLPRSPTKKGGLLYDSPSKVGRMGRSTTPTRPLSEKLKGMLFLLTKSTSEDQAILSLAIRQNGGTTALNWQDLFDRNSPGECGFEKDLDGTPFLILLGEGREGAVITPKVMVALAKGIPCLSARFIEDISDEDVDWRSYLISPGFSNHVEHYMSQVVDTAWGGEEWDSQKAGPIRRPLKGKTVLFILPSAKYESLKRLIPVCAYSMGVEEIHSVPNTKSSEGTIKDPKWDYVLVEEREYRNKEGDLKPLPKWLSAEQDRLCNVHWLKQCLIMGRALPPSLERERVEEKKK